MIAGALPGHLDQIALVVPDLEVAMDSYIDKLGVTFGVFEADESMSQFSGSSSRFRIRIAVAIAGLLSIELIQPVSGETLYSNYLATHGLGLHHLGLYVADLAEARKSFAGPKYRCVLEGLIKGLGNSPAFRTPAVVPGPPPLSRRARAMVLRQVAAMT